MFKLRELLTKLKTTSLNRQAFIIIGVVFALLILAQIGKQIFFKPITHKDIPLVRTQTVGTSSNTNNFDYPGEVRGKYESNLAFQTAGKIVQRHVNLGDSVKAGQVLLEIDPRDVAQIVSANSAVLASAQSQAELAEKNAQRFAELYANGAVSKATMEQYQNQANAARAAVQQAQAQLTGSSHQLEYTQLIADHDGVISALNGEIGMVVSAGTPLVTLVQKGEHEIQIFIPENQLKQVALGQKALIKFWAIDNLIVNGQITEIAPMADPITKTYKVRVALNQEPPTVKLGMTAKVSLVLGETDALTISSKAIYQAGDTPQVWLVQDNRVKLIPVTIAGYEGNNIIVTSGLKPGDKIVIGGINKLAEGQEVRLEESDAK